MKSHVYYSLVMTVFLLFIYREKKRETEREELWKRLQEIEDIHRCSKPGASVSVDNNNKFSNNINSVEETPSISSQQQ